MESESAAVTMETTLPVSDGVEVNSEDAVTSEGGAEHPVEPSKDQSDMAQDAMECESSACNTEANPPVSDGGETATKTEEPPKPNVIDPSVVQPSKNYLKKMEKRAKYEAVKLLKRKAEKAKLKLKRIEAANNGTPMPITRKTLLKTVKPIDFEAPSMRIAIDVSFDNKMTTSEKSKTCKQLLRVYTLNRRSIKPIPVYYCGMKEGSELKSIFKRNEGYENWDIKITDDNILEEFPKEKLVYLSSDSDNVLDKLSDDDVYVIGGLVDHNRHKGLCHDIAVQNGLRHARLPIKENVLMKTRTVLTIEQVFHMMIKVYHGETWTNALLDTIPKRKGAMASVPFACMKNLPGQPKIGHDSDSQDAPNDVTEA